MFNREEEPQPEDVAARRLLIDIQNRTNNLQNWYSHANEQLTQISEGYILAARLSVDILVDTENKTKEAARSAEQSGQEAARLIRVRDEIKNQTAQCAQSLNTVKGETNQVVQQSKAESAKNVKRDEFCGLIPASSASAASNYLLKNFKDAETKNRAVLTDLYNRMASSKQQNQLVACQFQQLSAERVNLRTQTSSCVTKIAESKAEIQRIVAEVLPMSQETKVCRQREAKLVDEQKAKLLPLQIAAYRQGALLNACIQSSAPEALELARLRSAMNQAYRQAIAHDDAKKSVTKEVKDAFTKDFAPDKCIQNLPPNQHIVFDLVPRYPQLARAIDFFNKPRPPILIESAEFKELEEKDPQRAAQYREEATKIKDECGQLWQYGRKIDPTVRAELAAGR